MADQGIWYKVYCSSITDPDLDNLDVSDFGRWAKMGAIVKAQGTNGTLVFKAPARTLCSALQVPDFDTLVAALRRLPGCRIEVQAGLVSNETSATFQFNNWARYQSDLSTPRVRAFRDRETAKKRRDEIRRDEKRGDENGNPVSALIDEHREGYRTLYTVEPMPVAQGEAVALSRVLDAYGLPKCLDLMRAFFRTEDKWVVSTGHKISTFEKAVPTLIRDLAKKSGSVRDPRPTVERPRGGGFIE